MFEQLGDGVFRRRYESLDVNVGVVLGEKAALVIDTRASLREASELQREMADLTDRPVRWVVNTHWHFDHTFGNAAFDGAEIWGHELCRVALVHRGEEMKKQAMGWFPSERTEEIDEVEIAPPVKTFSEQASLDVGRQIEMSYHGLGHTDSDIVVRVPDADVAFFGDLIEEGAPPSFGDGYPVSWPLALRLASESLPGVIVPGHGDVVDAAFVHSQHEELVVVAEMSSRYVAGEIDLEEAVANGPYPEEVMKSALVRAQAVA